MGFSGGSAVRKKFSRLRRAGRGESKNGSGGALHHLGGSAGTAAYSRRPDGEVGKQRLGVRGGRTSCDRPEGKFPSRIPSGRAHKDRSSMSSLGPQKVRFLRSLAPELAFRAVLRICLWAAASESYPESATHIPLKLAPVNGDRRRRAGLSRPRIDTKTARLRPEALTALWSQLTPP